jgi:hypothetical protein
MTAPCLLPEYQHIKAIRVASPRYWAQTIDLVAGGAQAEVLKRACTIYVKRKTGPVAFRSSSCMTAPFILSCC